MLPPSVLGIAGAAAWGVALVVAVVGLFVGVVFLKFLARQRVPWWPALIAPAVAFGPAIGLLLGAYLSTGSWGALEFWVADVPEKVVVGTEPPTTPLPAPSPTAPSPPTPSPAAPAPTAKTIVIPGVAGGHVAARFGWSLLFFFGAIGLYGLVVRFLTSRIVAEELGLKIPEVFVDLGRVLLWAVMLFVVVGVIWQKHEWFTALFTAGGLTILVLSLALQDTIKNFISAWAIVGEGVFTIGEWVFIGEDEGEVISITRRTTKIRTRSGDVVTVPNSHVTSSKVKNQSRPTAAHAEYVHVQVAYDAPPNRVRDALRRALLEVPAILSNPKPKFRLKQFADSGIEYQIKVWIEDIANLPDILSDLRVQIWYRFQREGLEFPYPVRELRRRGTRLSDPDAKPRQILSRLKSVPFFDALPEDLLSLLARDAALIEFGAGERVVQHGEPGDTCYVVDRGRLAVLVSDGAAERQVAVFGPGDLFGEMSLLTGEPRSATVRAMDDARLVSVGASSLSAALERSPDLAHRLAEVATLRKEGLLEARAALDAASRARVDAQTHRLRELIKRFFKLPDRGPSPTGAAPAIAPGAPAGPVESGPGRVAGGPPGP